MRRREFIGLLGGAAAWPVGAHAQQAERMRRIGSLTNLRADDPEGQARNTVFLQELAQLGWIAERNVQIDSRWAAGDTERLRKYAAELIALAPDVILARGSQAVAALLQATRVVPIVFETVADPVGAGFVENLGQPGGNATGFTVFEYGIAGKWLELLQEIAPRIRRLRYCGMLVLPPGFGVRLREGFDVLVGLERRQPDHLPAAAVDAMHPLHGIRVALLARFSLIENQEIKLPSDEPQCSTMPARSLIS